ncbi:hypothetical protein CROQUDRAFT_653931 [Cronartium quercuum f. sp. fusiforme G11]|uniref:Uncharacterized protein n=1 Tax=Cronartium quercuum f. sp. fusiforme G11 TaxID=708437 RepID=A0A9P6NTB3_9BASI|nr:hypothetical protein CROQUDRAFT_653931 [Cronartium quercuum f. sp. fusiforme G11]
MPSSITNTYVHLSYFSGVGVSLHGPATVSKCPSSHSQRMSIPNPNLDSPLCRRCGEDFPGRNKSQPLCDPLAPSSDPKALSPAHILSPKNHLRPHSLNPLPSPSSIDLNPSTSSFPLLLNISTPSSVNYAMHVDTNTQKAVAQANILQSRQRQLHINKRSAPYPHGTQA